MHAIGTFIYTTYYIGGLNQDVDHRTRGDLWHKKEVNQWGKRVELSEDAQIQGLAGSHEDVTQQGGRVELPESGQILGSAIRFLNTRSLFRPGDVDKIQVEVVGVEWCQPLRLLPDGLLQMGHRLGLVDIDIDRKDVVISDKKAPNNRRRH